jgi:glycosyltransferase involved in cell wall biosynthesis
MQRYESARGHSAQTGMNTRFPIVSILTPAYNQEAYIAACIESVLAQTYSNWEQIIIDDGSTDNTAVVVQGIRDPRIYFHRQANRGIAALAHTYNHALSLAKGEIIAILEGDDFWPPDKLSALVPFFADEEIVLAYGLVQECAVDGTLTSQLSSSVRRRRQLPDFILSNRLKGAATKYMLHADNMDLLPESTVLIRRSTLDSIGGFQCIPGISVASYPTFLELGLRGRFHFSPRVMGFRRRHASSASVRYFDQLLPEAERHARRFMDQHGSDLGLSDFERQQINKSWQRANYLRHFVAGRSFAIQGRWQEARRRFGQAMHPLLPRTFLASAAGWVLSGFRCDLERVLVLLGKTPLTERTTQKAFSAAEPTQPQFFKSNQMNPLEDTSSCRVLILTVEHHSGSLTARMVESLSKLKLFDKTSIVIVKNGPGAAVASSSKFPYESAKNVWIQESAANRGYFGGVRRGLEWFQLFRSDLPEWIIVCNNDIRIEQSDFFERLGHLDPGSIGVIAPKIISSRTGLNQNPFMVRRPGRWRVGELRFWLKSYYLAFIREKMSQWKKTGLGLKQKLLPRTSGGDGPQPTAIYAPHGSFLIFSKQFFTRGGFLDDATFLYHEEISVAEISKKLGLPVVYWPKLCVLHDEHSTTGMRFNRSIYENQKQSFHHLATNYLADLVR